MRRIQLIAVALVIISSTISACSKDSLPGEWAETENVDVWQMYGIKINVTDLKISEREDWLWRVANVAKDLQKTQHLPDVFNDLTILINYKDAPCSDNTMGCYIDLGDVDWISINAYRLREHSNEEKEFMILHEIAHVVDNMLSPNVPMFEGIHDKYKHPTANSLKNAKEAFADSFALYIQNSDGLKKCCPEFYYNLFNRVFNGVEY